MKLVKCIIRPNRLEEVREALSKLDISGMTVLEYVATAAKGPQKYISAVGNTASRYFQNDD
jgi:nitrogen regulatory protein PII